MIPFHKLLEKVKESFIHDILRFSRSEDEEDSNRTYKTESEQNNIQTNNN